MKAKLLLLFLIPVSAQAATVDRSGVLRIVTDYDRIEAVATVHHGAAKGLFELVGALSRIEYVSDSVRRVRGRTMTCYETGTANVDPAQWSYRCEFIVREGGIIAPPP